ncbi:SDR family NAD(P)-dependent oxidoreductase [Pseudoalteromonas sp. J010]|uniref:SDR family NAD(P)-dependent oxidoreductase n=1 Tax=Pseudoalteromonas sp. J010 TaxID=998465 RepID=UPI000F648EAB|nr:SDR family NAD(P)-dependent oxidoreductase [Pseudoalteromonas sp. J010]RRS10444.1 SDR family NAD(P)-dependent oxidoreductase [Pseudoalteromonas sp. J010]
MTAAGPQALVEEYPTGIFTSIFTGKEAFLADHIIQGQKILPGMAYLEISRAAIERLVPMSDQHMVVLKDSVFVSALLVSKECALEVHVYPGSTGEFGIEVKTELGVHFQSKAYIKERHVYNNGEVPKLDLDQLKSKCAKLGPTKQAFYDYFKNRGVLLGPSHRGVESIYIGDECALSKISLPNSSKRGMCMDPGMLDSIIQGGVALSTDPDENEVPFAVVQTEIFSPLVDTMYGYIEKTAEGINYTASDEQGNVCVRITGFLTREIDLSSNQPQLVYYKPKWVAVDTIADDPAPQVIVAQGDYTSLVKSVSHGVKTQLNDKNGSSRLDIHLNQQQSAFKGIMASLKTITQEHAKFECRLYQQNKELQLSYSETDMSNVATFVWPDNKCILITGGLGGVGRLVAADIAKHSQGNTLVLTGRSAIDGAKQRIIDELSAQGATVQYVQCDITNEHEVAALIAQYPNIQGVFHCAGTIKDNYINNKSNEEIDQVLAPKVTGLDHLDKATAALTLDYFVCFSSIAGALGNSGQFDYAAANGYMDASMQQRAELVKLGQRSGNSVSINWPLWDSEGMQLDEESKQKLFNTFKIRPLPADAGIEALKKVLASGETQLVVLFGNKKAVAGLFKQKQKINKQDAPSSSHKTSVKSEKLEKEILLQIRAQTAEHLKLRANQIDDEADWPSFGFDSIMMSSFVNRLNMRFGLNLMPTVLFEASNIKAFTEYLAENCAEELAEKLSVVEQTQQSTSKAQAPQSNVSLDVELNAQSAFAQTFKKSYVTAARYREKDIAIIGLSCRVAGARTPQEFWDMLIQEKDMISEIPADRWDWRDYPGVSKWGSFVDGVAEFDPLFFGISPAEAMYMTPEQRLMMQYVWECVEHSGCAGEDIKGTDTGLFVGCGPSGYSSILHGLPIEAYSATGTVDSMGPNRISYLMDWHGPSNPIDTACSSALVALHRAVEAIRAGHCKQAVAGGVNLLLSVDGYISFAKSGMLCEDGRCKTFSDKANGYVRGEGVGMLMVKSLPDALKDGNTIYAVVKGTAENHGGRSTSLTAPNPKAQAAVVKKAIADAGVDFTRLSYIECHGTGTELGDPVEVNGLKMVSRDLGGASSNHECVLGSVKSNIGHLEYSAGVVGLIKVIMQLKHKKIAKSLHSDTLNPYIDLKSTPYRVAQQAMDWIVPEGQTRVAGVSSFGFGGVNAHVILEEFNSELYDLDTEQNNTTQRYVFPLSAKNEERLLDYVAELSKYCQSSQVAALSLRDIAYTMQLGRAEMQERVAFIASSLTELTELADDFVASQGKSHHMQVMRGRVKSNATEQHLVLNDTPAGREFLDNLIESNETDKLAELWSRGTRIDWNKLYTK